MFEKIKTIIEQGNTARELKEKELAYKRQCENQIQ
jgi:hypothetical protein